MSAVNYRVAEFRSWCPPGFKSTPLKGILVLVPGSNGDGRNMIYWKPFRDFARTHHVALVGCHFEDQVPGQIEDYSDASGGSGQALLDFIESSKDLPSNVPLFLWGHSAGGQFNYEFACWAPERVGAFVVNKGGFYYHALAPPATRKLPALFITGGKDAISRQAIIIGIYLMNNRDEACRWELLTEEDIGHDLGTSVTAGLDLFARQLTTKKEST